MLLILKLKLQLHQQNNQQQQYQQQPQQPPEPAQRTWKAPSPQPPPERNWNPQGFVLHERNNQPFQVHYNTDRYQNGTENVRETQNHLSYTVINPNQYASQSPPLSSPRRAKTPQRQGSLPEARRPEPVALHQLTHHPAPHHSPAPHHPPAPEDMEPQNISFIGNAEDDALRQGINRLNISSGTRTYRIPSPTRPSLANSFQQIDNEPNEKGFYISFDNEQPKRPKPPLRAKRGSPRKERAEYGSPERSPENTWSEPMREEMREEPREMRRQSPVRERMRPPSAEPAALIIGESNLDPVSFLFN